MLSRAPVLTALLVVLSGAATAAPDADSTEAVALPAAEERFEALAESLDTALLTVRADPTFDEIAILEAEEIARVAGELLEEGDPQLAAELLAEALALLDPPE